MNFTYYGHSCFGVNIEGKNLLFDPFITGNPLAKEVDIKSIKANYILISHAHGDHILNVDEVIENNPEAKIIANVEICNYFAKKGYATLEMNSGGTLHLDFGKVIMTAAVHSSSFPDGSYGGNPNGFAVKPLRDSAFYFSGDTALFGDMEWIGKLYEPEFALLCCGGHYTMDLATSFVAAKLLGVNEIVGMHFNSFPPISIKEETASELIEKHNIKLKLPKVLETWEA